MIIWVRAEAYKQILKGKSESVNIGLALFDNKDENYDDFSYDLSGF